MLAPPAPTPAHTMAQLFDQLGATLRGMHASGTAFVLLRYSPAFSPREFELDILVPRRSKDAFVSGLLSRLPPTVSCIAIKWGLTGVRLVLAQASDNAANTISALVLDIRELIVKNGAILAEYATVVREERAEEDGLPVPDRCTQAALLIARNVWAQRELSARHRDILTRGWGGDVLARLPEFLVTSSGATYEAALVNATMIRPPLSRRARQPVVLLRTFARHLSRSYLCTGRNRPSVLAIHGPDGIGKTTAAATAAAWLAAPKVRILAQHFTGKEITTEYLGRQRQRAAARPPQPVRTATWWEIAQRVLLFPARHVQFLRDLRRKRRYDIVVYDRFSFDHLHKGHALLIAPSLKLRIAAAGRRIRLSDRVSNVVLSTDAARIAERKPEMTADQIAMYFQSARVYFGDDAVWVDASSPPDEVSGMVVAAFLRSIDAKLRRYWLRA